MEIKKKFIRIKSWTINQQADYSNWNADKILKAEWYKTLIGNVFEVCNEVDWIRSPFGISGNLNNRAYWTPKGYILTRDCIDEDNLNYIDFK